HAAAAGSRRIVPPPMPSPHPQASTYVRPRKFEVPSERTWTQSVVFWSACVIAAIVVVSIFIYAFYPETTYTPQQYQAAKALVEPSSSSADAQPAAARTNADETPGGAGGGSWVGTLRLDDVRATIGVRAFAIGSEEARQYTTSEGKHPVVAILTIDNTT